MSTIKDVVKEEIRVLKDRLNSAQREYSFRVKHIDHLRSYRDKIQKNLDKLESEYKTTYGR